jgi:hypothetical protein
MNTQTKLLRRGRQSLAAACLASLALTGVRAQQPAQPDAATLAKYDVNHNGVLDPAEQAALDRDQAAAANAATTSTAPGGNSGEQVVSLSPFEVVSDTKGYYAANTMSGTRFNTRLEDLASPITVVTKEQMEDFAMLDINDIFQYTASTEGTNTYTDFTVDRNGSVSDNVQTNPNQANRIRGLQSANISFNNFEMSSRMPVDPTVTNGVEISRGPNANVFGLGNPSGTVNQVAAAANLSRNRSSVQFRADSYDGWRTSLDLNRVLKQNVLAVRGSAVYQHDGFVRKPSGMDGERYNAMIKYQPFKTTTVTAGVYYYHQYGNRPNFVNPRDSVSYWISQGRPTWDPIDEVVHVGGKTLGPFTADTNVPDALQRTFTGNGHSYIYIDPAKGVTYFTEPNTAALVGTVLAPAASLVGTTAPANQTVRLFNSNSAAGANTTGNLGKIGGQPLFTTTPSINDKSIYDWTKINLAAPNLDWDRDLVSNVQLDQVFVNTQRQTLSAQVAFMREDTNRYRRDYLGGVANDNGQSGQLLVDVNEKNLDGTPNPNLGRFYLGQDQPRTTFQPLKWDSYRAQVGYKLDLTHENGWLKWLGSHQLAGYDEYKYRISRRYSFREAILDQHPWIPVGQSHANQGAISGGPAAALSITRSYLRYYVGDPNTNRIDYAPGNLVAGSYPLVYGTYTFANRTVNGQTVSLATPGSGVFNSEPTQFGLAAVTDSSGAGSNTKTILKTTGGILQSHFLNDRLVTTFGLREDKQYVKTGSTPQLLNPDGTTFNYDSLNHWAAGDYKFNSGKTKQGGAVLRPFEGWSVVHNLDQAGTGGHFLASALNGLFFTYNKSDSFQPQDPKNNLFFQPLPNTTGHGKDYGFGVDLFDHQLVLRYNHYEQKTLNYRQGDASTIAQRVTRIDIASNARFLLYNQMYSPTATAAASSTSTDIGWVRQLNPGFSEAQVQAEVGKEFGMPYDQILAVQAAFNAGSIASTQDVIGKGDEVEINYVSPSRNWTIAANGTQTQAYNTNISADIQQWIDQRMPIWTTIKDPRDGQLWWTKSYGGSQTAAQNFDSFVRIPLSIVRAQDGKSNPTVSRYSWRVSTNYRLAGITDNSWLKRIGIGGALRWQSPVGIGYYGIKDSTGVYTDLNPNNPVYSKARLHADAFINYQTRLWRDKVGARFQLNVVDLQENGRLEPLAVYPDGTPNAYRIIDPRKFIFTVTFDM